MTYDELMQWAQSKLILAQSQNKAHHAHEIEKAINTLRHCVLIKCRASYKFAVEFLKTAIDDFENEGE